MGIESTLGCKLIRLFVGESTKLVAEIERAAANADVQAIFRPAHSLKSSAASVGAMAFSATARELEALARSANAEALVGHPVRLRREFARFCEEPQIRAILNAEPAERSAA